MAGQDDGVGAGVGGGHVPQPGGAVIRCGRQPAAIRAEGHGIDGILMAGQDDGVGAGVGGGHVPQPGGVVRGCGRQPAAIRAEGHVKDGILMAGKRLAADFAQQFVHAGLGGAHHRLPAGDHGGRRRIDRPGEIVADACRAVGLCLSEVVLGAQPLRSQQQAQRWATFYRGSALAVSSPAVARRAAFSASAIFSSARCFSCVAISACRLASSALSCASIALSSARCLS